MKEQKDGPPSAFLLKDAGGSFAGRSNDVFAGLDAVEKKHNAHEETRTDHEEFANLKPADDLDPGCASSSKDAPEQSVAPFRRPRGRGVGQRRTQVPDHGKGPQNWKFYNLEDVEGSALSEKSNTQAALAFLDERRKLMEVETEEQKFDVGSAACSKGLFSFAKQSKTKSSTDEDGSLEKGLKTVRDTGEERLLADSFSDDQGSKDAPNIEDAPLESLTSTETEAEAKPSFKKRKGMKRSIRSREEDGD